MKPKNVMHGAGQREAGGLHELAFDDEDGDRAEDQAAENRAAAEHEQAVVEHALVPHLADEIGQLLRVERRDRRTRRPPARC